MATSLKIQKELQLRVHESLYKNIYMLTLVYPPSKEFKSVFKPDMFMKNNKAGFQQVVYYLLNVLDPNRLKQRVSSWPIIDNRTEIKFRNEIMTYANELNSLYEHSNIPHLVTSHLISPGGFKFIKFMFHLSQLVVLEHLKRNYSEKEDLLCPLKPSKQLEVTKENLKKLAVATQHLNEEAHRMRMSFENRLVRVRVEAEGINKTRQTVNESLSENKVTLHKLEEELGKCNPNYESDLLSTHDDLKVKLSSLVALKQKFTKCAVLNKFLSGSHSELHCDDLGIPSEIAHIIRFENGNVDLTTVFKGFDALINRKRLELHLATDEKIHEEIQKFSIINKSLELVAKDLDEAQNQQYEMKAVLEKEQDQSLVSLVNTVRDELGSSSGCIFSSTPLALPLATSQLDDDSF